MQRVDEENEWGKVSKMILTMSYLSYMSYGRKLFKAKISANILIL